MNKLVSMILAAACLFSVGCSSEYTEEEVATAQMIDIKAMPVTAEPKIEVPVIESPQPTNAVKPAEPARIYGLLDTEVVCAKCDPELLAAKTRGVKAALAKLVESVGDALPLAAKPVLHASDDDVCDSTAFIAAHKFLTGEVKYTHASDGVLVRHICTYDVEKTTAMTPSALPMPFGLVEAEDPARQMLVVHEAMHIWFVSRVSSVESPYTNYWAEEAFCDRISWAQTAPATDFCLSASKWTNSTDLIVGLCNAGMTMGTDPKAMRSVSAAADVKHALLKAAQPLSGITEVGLAPAEMVIAINTAVSTPEMPIDVTNAFAAAGLLK